MDDRYAHEDADMLKERLLRVENALFCLRARVACFPDMDCGELERLESLRLQIRARCERLSQAEDAMAG